MLKKKSDTFKFFKMFKALVEKEKERETEIKCLRTNNGDEYTFTKFIEFCSEHSIEKQYTVLGTPQQNELYTHGPCKKHVKYC